MLLRGVGDSEIILKKNLASACRCSWSNCCEASSIIVENRKSSGPVCLLTSGREASLLSPIGSTSLIQAAMRIRRGRNAVWDLGVSSCIVGGFVECGELKVSLNGVG